MVLLTEEFSIPVPHNEPQNQKLNKFIGYALDYVFPGAALGWTNQHPNPPRPIRVSACGEDQVPFSLYIGHYGIPVAQFPITSPAVRQFCLRGDIEFERQENADESVDPPVLAYPYVQTVETLVVPHREAGLDRYCVNFVHFGPDPDTQKFMSFSPHPAERPFTHLARFLDEVLRLSENGDWTGEINDAWGHYAEDPQDFLRKRHLQDRLRGGAERIRPAEQERINQEEDGGMIAD